MDAANATLFDWQHRRIHRSRWDDALEFFGVLVHQSLPIRVGKKIVAQQNQRYLGGWALLLFPSFAALYIAHYFGNDQQKTPLELYFRYRFGMAAAILCIGAIAVIFRQRVGVLRACFLVLATLLSVVQAWSMTLGPAITIKWIVWLPALVFIVTSNSLVFSVAWLGALVAVTQPYWEGKELVTRALFSDFTIAFVALLFAQIARRIWIISGINYHMFELVTEELREQERIFYKEMRKFIAPVLVERIEKQREKHQSPIEPVDEVLKRTRKQVVVLFSDLKDFSQRSEDREFVEKELIPSAISIIDEAEKNKGIAKQIGDAVLIYYDLEDPELSLLRAVRDGLRSAGLEADRVRSLAREYPERFFSIAIGIATVGNMASVQHYEPTVIGKPANLAARIDALTRQKTLQEILLQHDRPTILLSGAAGEVLKAFSRDLKLRAVELQTLGLQLKSYADETRIFLFTADETNLSLLNQILRLNAIEQLWVRGEC
ncbi:MAG: hypothetical protein IT285_10940 [Bdellovibrionales bacterium]|nr:hypothetical protein [Bdellovibrionales bacterium]